MTFLSHSDVPVSALQTCDKALEHAVNSGKKEHKATKQRFDHAIRKLYEYEKDFYTE
jgi:hypothetical protein